jgi:glycosyltransferase involved in cell wall biosynthesis
MATDTTTDAPLHVLAVIDGLALGGAERVLATLARAGRDHRMRLSVASLTGEVGEGRVGDLLAREGVEVHQLDVHGLRDVRDIRRLARVIRHSGADVVHCHLHYAAVLGVPAAALAGVPAVCTFHHVARAEELRGRAGLRERIAVASAGAAQRVVFVSYASLESFRRLHVGRRSHWTVVHNGVDVDEFRPAPGARPPADLAVPPDAATVVLVAAMRGAFEKGHEEAIDAWPAVRAVVPDARLVFVGGGDNEAALRSRAEAAGVADGVVFAGTRGDVDAIVRSADVALLPSRNEALPTVLLESAASGVPAVATRVGGIPEIVRHDANGLLVDPGDVGAVADAVLRLLTDPDTRQRLGDTARRDVLERFDARDWVTRLRTVYRDAGAGRPGRVRRRRATVADVGGAAVETAPVPRAGT